MSLVTDRPTNITIAIDRCISDNKGDQLALRYRDKRYSYNDLAALMNRAGNMLKRLDVKVGDQILVAVSPSPSLVASVLGAMKIGATAIVVPSNDSVRLVEKLAAHVSAKLLIVDATRLTEFGNVKLRHLVVGEIGEGQQSFLQEMRTSASSLSRALETADAPALGVAGPDDVVWFSHAQIAGADGNGNAALEKVAIGKALVQLLRGEEVAIS